MEREIKLTVTGLVYNQTVIGTYGLVLSEVAGNRRFSVMIGEPEAQSIALKINNKKSPRPLTHDLIKNILNVLDVELTKVVIYDMINDVFYSELHIVKDERLLIVDARTSDAVALAVRTECPIFIKSSILDVVGTEVDVNVDDSQIKAEEKVEELNEEDLELMDEDTLEELLQTALTNENYELAVKLRDALKKKKQ